MIHRIVKHTKNSGAFTAAGKTGKALTSLLPKTVELHQMRTPVRRMLILTIELVVGMLVLGAFLLGLFYYRLEKGAIDLDFVVPSIERAINEQLTDLSVKIDSAFVGKNTHSAGVHFRLRNIVLYNKEGEAIANSPLAAVDLNGSALMGGRIAPSQVVFIKPTLDIAYNEGQGLSLSYAPNSKNSDVIADLLTGMGEVSKSLSNASNATRPVQNIEFMKAVSAAFEEARSHRNTTSYLTQFGVRDATVNFSQGGAKYSWKIPDFIIDLKHSDKGSLIRGFGKLGIGEAEEKITPWKLRFQTQQFDNSQDLQLDVGFKDITPISLHRLLPELDSLKAFNIPFSGKINAKLNHLGELQSAFASLHLAAGKVYIPWLSKKKGIKALTLDSSEVKLAYSSKGNKLHILPSPFKWGQNQTVLSGIIQADTASRSSQKWNFTLQGAETRLAAKDFGLGAMIIDEWWITGSINPEQDFIEIAGFYVRAGNATINLKGLIRNYQSSPGIFLQGKLASISVPVLKRLWPSIIAVDPREWVGESISEGQIVAGNFKIAIPSGTIEKLPDHGDLLPKMVQMKLELSDLVMDYVPDLLPLVIPAATLKITGRQLSFDVPKGRIYFRPGDPLKISHGHYTISDLRKETPGSDISFRVAGEAQDLLKFIQQPALKLAKKTGIVANQIEGKLKGVISLHVPLKDDVNFEDITLKADLRLRNMKSKKLFGDVSVEAGTVNIKVTEKAVGADGGIVLKGVPAKLNWQHIFGASKMQQPPIRLSAVVGKTSRTKLGLSSINDILKGDIPVVATITLADHGKHAIQVRADLTNTRINNTSFGWSKPPGAAAVLQFDIHQTKSDDLDLRNFSLVGHEIAVEGNIRLNSKTKRMESFSFPQVSYKQIDQLAVSGKRHKNGILEINAKIQSLDGPRILRQQFFNKSQTVKITRKNKPQSDYNLHAEISTIVGRHGAYINGAKLNIRKRGGKLSWLDFRGRLNGQSMIAVRLEKEKVGHRVLKAESTDAGATLRMFGLYPNIQGGQLSLKVNMDAKGTKGKTGTLWVKNFFVISSQTIDPNMKAPDAFKNDFIVSGNTRKSRGRPRVVRTKIQFDQLKAPFSYWDGQFILHNSYVNGPVIGATLRGKIDFRTEQIRLGGTYIPLYGLNSAIGEIPVLSDLLVGRQGEGVFGVTFAIEGPTSKPTVIVNPVSLLTPGVFRQIFDFNNSVKNQQFRKLPKKRKKVRRKRYRSDRRARP